jgi:hypothetical protein
MAFGQKSDEPIGNPTRTSSFAPSPSVSTIVRPSRPHDPVVSAESARVIGESRPAPIDRRRSPRSFEGSVLAERARRASW